LSSYFLTRLKPLFRATSKSTLRRLIDQAGERDSIGSKVADFERTLR
jgi:hypothetical protein